MKYWSMIQKGIAPPLNFAFAKDSVSMQLMPNTGLEADILWKQEVSSNPCKVRNLIRDGLH